MKKLISFFVQTTLNQSSSSTLWKTYHHLMNSSLFLASTQAKKTEVRYLFFPQMLQFSCFHFSLILPLIVNPKPPGIRTHLRWIMDLKWTNCFFPTEIFVLDSHSFTATRLCAFTFHTLGLNASLQVWRQRPASFCLSDL